MRLGLGALIVLAALAVYANALPGEFLFDDYNNVVRNPGIRTLPSGEEVPVTLMRRPVVRWSFALNYALGGLDPRGYRAVNVAIHVLAALCLFGVVWRSFGEVASGPGAEGRALAVGFASALLWVVHPLQTESVTYVSQRLEALVGLWILVGLYALARGARSARPWPWYVAALAAGWIGMGTKELMLVAPVVWALYDRAFLAGSWRALWRARWGLYLGLVPAAVALSLAAAPTVERDDLGLGFGLDWISPWRYLGAQPGVILHYLRLAVWPQRLCLDYFWPVPTGVGEVIWPGLVVGGLALASVIGWWRAPRLGFLGLAFFLLLAPTSSVMPMLDAAVEHRMYLPLACVVVVAVVAALRAGDRMPVTRRGRVGLGSAVLVLVTVALGARTAARNLDYREERRMWVDVIECAPHNPRAHANLGAWLNRHREYERAIEHLSRAIALAPDYWVAHANLAGALRTLGRIDEALAHYQKVLALGVDRPIIHYRIAGILQRQGKLAEAFPHYEAAVAGLPNFAEAWDEYGVAKVLADDFAGAVPLFRRAIAVDPRRDAAHLHLGLALAALGEEREAVAALREALRLNPRARRALRGLARILTETTDPALRDPVEAVRVAEELTRGGTQGSVEELGWLAAAYARAGRFPDAAGVVERARAQADAAARMALDRDLACYRAGRLCEP